MFKYNIFYQNLKAKKQGFFTFHGENKDSAIEYFYSKYHKDNIICTILEIDEKTDDYRGYLINKVVDL